jgi:hypothetical protein
MNDNGYGLWELVVFDSLQFVVFAAGFFHPTSSGGTQAPQVGGVEP